MEQIKKLIRRDWPYLIGILVVFILMVISGYFLQQANPQITQVFQKVYFERLKQLVDFMKGQPVPLQIVIIWLNNLTASVSAISLGILLAVFPAFSLIGNGLAIGIMQHIVQHSGVSATRFYLALLPHGIFELPAFFMAAGLGIRLGIIPFRLIWQRHMTREHHPLFRIFFQELRYYLALITVLLFVAAVIEIIVSPMMLK
jgi:stage II sporulation protein M